MKIKIERKEKVKKTDTPRKVPTIKVGTHRKLTLCLWVLLIGSVVFGIYKNFTAINTHTVIEKKVIKQKVVDTNKIESFLEEFATTYFSWQQSQASIDKRNEQLKNYFTEELQQLNIDIIRVDIPTTSTVQKIQIWNVNAKTNTDFEVIFSIKQLVTENDSKQVIVSTYQVTVHMDKSDNMVVIQNPTITRKPQKSDYEPKLVESDGTVNASTTEEINTFLETFFKLYPKASSDELAYYVSNNVLPIINKDYVFVGLVNPVYTQLDNQVIVIVTVKYLDQETKMIQLSQFEITLIKQGNWKIIK